MTIKFKPRPLLFVVLLAVILLILGISWVYLASPVDKNDKKDIEVEITKGISVVKISTILKALTIYGSVTSHIDSIDVDISDGILQDNSSALPERSDKLPSFPKSSCLSK